MIDKYNYFDVRLAYQFLKNKNDIESNEDVRECYRHTNRVLNSPYSSESAKILLNFYVDVIKKNPENMAKCKSNLAKVCRRIIKKSKPEIQNIFDEITSKEILSFSDE